MSLDVTDFSTVIVTVMQLPMALCNNQMDRADTSPQDLRQISERFRRSPPCAFFIPLLCILYHDGSSCFHCPSYYYSSNLMLGSSVGGLDSSGAW